MSRVLLTLAFCLVTDRGVTAQEARGEVAVGYAWENDDGGFKLPVGWIASAAYYVSPLLAAVGEAGGNYHFDRVPNLPGYTYANQRYNINVHTMSGGFRASTPRFGRVSAFAQLLVGAHRMAGNPLEPFDWRQWALLVQPGGGASIAVTSRLDVRAAIDVPLARERVFAQVGPDTWEYVHEYYRATRIGAGIAFKF